MKRTIIAVLALILLAGCAGQGDVRVGESGPAVLPEEPGMMGERQLSIVTIGAKDAARMNLPLIVPVLGKPGETPEEIRGRASDGFEKSEIYWGIKLFIQEVDSDITFKEVYDSGIRNIRQATQLSDYELDSVFPYYMDAKIRYMEFMKLYEIAYARQNS